MANLTDPLVWNNRIVSANGLPTPQFLRQWNTQMRANSDIAGKVAKIGDTMTGVLTINLNSAPLPAPLTTGLQIGGADGATPRLTIDAFGTAGTISGRRADGTNAAKTAVGAGEVLLFFGGAGWDGSVYSSSQGSVQIRSNEAYTGTAHGTYVAIFTTPNGSVAAAVERVRIAADGSLQMGGANIVIDAVRSFQLRNYATGALPAAPATDGLLVYDSTVGAVVFSKGAAWVAVGAGGGPAFHPGFQSGRFYTEPAVNSFGTTGIAINLLYATPFFVPVDTTFTKVSVNITAAAAAGKLLELGVYANSSGIPGAKEFDAGSIAADVTGVREIASLTWLLTAGWHWLVVGSDGAPTLTGIANASRVTSWLIGMGTLGTTVNGIFGAWTFAAGALPATFPTPSYSTGGHPSVFLRV